MNTNVPVGMARCGGPRAGTCLANEVICESPVPGRCNSRNSRPSIVSAVARLARQLESGELSPLGRLYDVAAGRLVRYADTLARNPHDDEDALQAYLMRIADNPCRLASARGPWAYLRCILRK